jgi:hypothetical protein
MGRIQAQCLEDHLAGVHPHRIQFGKKRSLLMQLFNFLPDFIQGVGGQLICQSFPGLPAIAIGLHKSGQQKIGRLIQDVNRAAVHIDRKIIIFPGKYMQVGLVVIILPEQKTIPPTAASKL